jgi:hypothetical protein
VRLPFGKNDELHRLLCKKCSESWPRQATTRQRIIKFSFSQTACLSNTIPSEARSQTKNYSDLKFRAVSTKLLHEYEQLTASALPLDQGSTGSNNSTTAFTGGRLPDTYRNPRPDNLPQDTCACYKKKAIWWSQPRSNATVTARLNTLLDLMYRNL